MNGPICDTNPGINASPYSAKRTRHHVDFFCQAPEARQVCSLGISMNGNTVQIQCNGCLMVAGSRAWNSRMATTVTCSLWMAVRCLTLAQTALFGTTATKDSHSWPLVEMKTVENPI